MATRVEACNGKAFTILVFDVQICRIGLRREIVSAGDISRDMNASRCCVGGGANSVLIT